MSLILDASATLGFVMPDEATQASRELLVVIQRSGAWVPSLWRLEVANSLSAAIRRGRINREFRDDTLDDLLLLDILVDERTDSAAWGGTLTVADRHSLTFYDSAYLELAQGRKLAAGDAGCRVEKSRGGGGCRADIGVDY